MGNGPGAHGAGFERHIKIATIKAPGASRSKRSADGGKTWNAVELVHEEGGKEMIGIGNPCPVVDVETGHIWLFFCRRNRNVMVTHSTDDGKTWAKVEEMKSLRKPDWSWYATGPGIGIQKRQAPHKGRLVIPCDHRVGNEVLSQSHVLFSDDHGKTWQLGGDVAPRTNECQVAERSDGSLLINARNHWARDGADKSKGGVRITAVSKDGGSTWGDVRFDKALIEPICQASLLRYSSGEGKQNRLLFCNPAHPTKRRILTIRLSYDDGETWPVSKALTVWGAEEYVAYSSLVVLPDGDIGCMYERYQKESGRVGIAFTRLSLAWLTDGKDK
ncbi:MAG: glycoside hydrolase, partial [Planctomycetes bacterium]|nr:glycoside hydrolase [Planctomycetota bacterium]